MKKVGWLVVEMNEFLSNLIRLIAPSHHTSNISPRPAVAPDSKTSTVKKMSIQFAK
jgi:hypothetical protein